MALVGASGFWRLFALWLLAFTQSTYFNKNGPHYAPRILKPKPHGILERLPEETADFLETPPVLLSVAMYPLLQKLYTLSTLKYWQAFQAGS